MTRTIHITPRPAPSDPIPTGAQAGASHHQHPVVPTVLAAPHQISRRPRDAQEPLVSVVIPTYNRAPFLLQAIESVLGQTYQNVEVIVVDDGSTDGTSAALHPYLDRITYIQQDNRGASVARNVGIAASNGEFIAFLDSDDLWLPDKLSAQLSLLHSHPEIALVGGHALILGDAPDSTPHLFSDYNGTIVPFEQVLLDTPLMTPTIVVRRSCLPDGAPFTPGLRFGEDWELYLRVALAHPVGFIPKVMAHVRRPGDNITTVLASQPQVDLRLQNRLHVINHICSLLPSGQARRNALRAKAEAREYAETAIPSYVNGEFRLGAERLATAARLDPATWQDGEELVQLAVHYFKVLAKVRGRGEAARYLDQLFRHLPPAVRNRPRFQRQVYSDAHMALAFGYYSRGEFGCVLPEVLHGIINRPAWLSNPGVRSIIARSLLPWLRSAPSAGGV